MDELMEIIVYPIERYVTLLFSLTYDSVSVGSLMIASILISIIFASFLGSHTITSAFEGAYDNERSSTKAEYRANGAKQREYNNKLANVKPLSE